METLYSQALLQQQTIHFSNQNVARAVIASPQIDISISAIIDTLAIPLPSTLLLLMGGAQFSSALHKKLLDLFINGIARAAIAADAAIIDGGTEAGIMKLIGLAMAHQGRSSHLLGVAPSQPVTYPGKPVTDAADDTVPLDPNHANFVLVRSAQWGDETEMMYRLAAYLSRHCPSLAVLINGGAIARRETLYNVRQGRSIVVVEGSGRLADTLATHWREGTMPTDDPELCEILDNGNITLFPAVDPPAHFVELAIHLLQKQERAA